tara:strand:+ start:419 stop:799 length:381 start_codon:yes stop_codon:yes gene_type:complete
MTKQCYKCKAVKDISLFYRNKCRKDGRQGECKVCKNKIDKIWKKANPEKYSKYNCTPRRNKKQKIASKMRSRKLRRNLSDSYIRDLATMNSKLKPEDLSDEFVELYRLNLKLKRELELTPKLKSST